MQAICAALIYPYRGMFWSIELPYNIIQNKIYNQNLIKKKAHTCIADTYDSKSETIQL